MSFVVQLSDHATEVVALTITGSKPPLTISGGVATIGPGFGNPPIWYPVSLGEAILMSDAHGVPQPVAALLWGQGTAFFDAHATVLVLGGTQTSGLAAPTSPPSVHGSPFEGNVPPGLYGVVITFTNGSGGETTPSPPATTTIPGVFYAIAVDNPPSAPAGAVNYRVYMTPRGGGTTYYLQNGTGTSVRDFYLQETAPVTNTAQPPTSNTASTPVTLVAAGTVQFAQGTVTDHGDGQITVAF